MQADINCINVPAIEFSSILEGKKKVILSPYNLGKVGESISLEEVDLDNKKTSRILLCSISYIEEAMDFYIYSVNIEEGIGI